MSNKIQTMDEFILPIDANKFRSTNQAWNSLKLNDPWSVGYTTTLVALETFSKKEEWEIFYYESGAQRSLQMKNLSEDYQKLVNDEQLALTNEGLVKSLSWDLKNLNFQFGRTEDQLRKKGLILHNTVKDNGYQLSIEDCFQCVRFRTICETWNGVIIREANTVSTLKNIFPQVDFRKTEGDFDHKYAVDYEVFKNGTLVYALQIKPESYTWNAPYISKARFANQKKNRQYTTLFDVPVYDVISNGKGEIKNPEILRNL